MEGVNDSSRGRSSSPRAKPWSAADSDRCECVLEVMPDDVLLGRGSGPNDHVGNITFRDLVHGRKVEYLSTNHRQTKAVIAKDIVDQVYQQGGRFLKKLGVVESAKVLPKLLATKNAMDDSENDRADAANPGPCDVYQIQKHTTVMEKTKQALRQNQRNASPCPPENRSMSPTKDPANVGRDSMGRANNLSPDTPPHGIPHNSNNNNNNWNGVSMGNIPTTLNNSSHDNNNGQRHHGGQFHNNNNNNMRDSYDIPNMNYSSSAAQGQNQDSYQQQMYQQQQEVINLQKQHDLLQLQYQQRQQQNQQQQFQSQQLEIETRNKQLLQEQLELQIRQEQLRQLQQQSLQKLANNTAMYSSHQQDATNDPQQQQQFHRSENTPNQAQNAPPAVLNGYATYTTTLDAIEDGHQNSHDGLADPQGSMNKSDGASLDTETKFDDKSMQMSTMMGSFKDMSVKFAEDHSMHGSTQSIGTIDNVPASLLEGGLSMVHMSGISIMSLMNDSTDSLFKNPQKVGNDVGAKNAMWSTHIPSSSTAPLADVIESTNPAAVAAAAVLGKPVPVFDRAQRRWSGGYVPDTTEVPIQRRVNRRGSLQHNNSNNSNDLNQMQATASAMLAMAAAEHNQQLQQQQYMSQSFNYTHSPNGHSYGVSQETMNPPNQGFLMENGGYSMNVPFQG